MSDTGDRPDWAKKLGTGERPTWASLLDDEEVDALVRLWLDAAARGWRLWLARESQAWAMSTDDGEAGAWYTPPSEVHNGRADAHDARRTVTMTGLESHAEAVAAMRWFLGWTPGALPPAPVPAVEAAA